MNKKYTKRQEDFIKNNYKKYTIYELTDLFNKEFGTSFNFQNIKDKKYSMGLVKYKQLTKKATYNSKEIKFLKKKYNKYTNKELALLFNKKFKRNITPRQIIEIKYRFADTKVRKIYKKKLYCESKHQNYTIIKVGNNNFINKARYIWQKKYGEIPKNCSVIHLDNNKQNNKISNLKLVSNKELAMLNRTQMISNNKQYTRTGLLIVKLRLRTILEKKTQY